MQSVRAQGAAPELPYVRAAQILVVAPSPPPYGGMALQARLLERSLTADGHAVNFVASNLRLPAGAQFMERLRVVRPILRSAVFSTELWRRAAGIDVMHVFAASWLYFFAVVTPSALIGRMRGKHVVLNYRGGEAASFLRCFGWAARPIFRLATVVTTPSEFLAGVIRNRMRVPVQIVPNIVDLASFTFRIRTPLRPRMVVARHLEKTYDVETALRAFCVVQQRYPEASLCIAGTGSQEQRLRALAAEWNLTNVEFVGQVPHDQLPAIYDRCDILLNASQVDNFPGALIEASAAGLVVVSTSAPGIAFMYENRKSALLVDPGDWEGLGRAIEIVLSNPTLAAELVTSAANLARSCAWQQVRRRLYLSYGLLGEN